MVAAAAGKDQLDVAMRSEKCFPYGGESANCPGRHFSKLEILSAIGLMVGGFEMEAVGIVDGNCTLRGGRLGARLDYAGGGVMPPDGDLMVRMKRI